MSSTPSSSKGKRKGANEPRETGGKRVRRVNTKAGEKAGTSESAVEDNSGDLLSTEQGTSADNAGVANKKSKGKGKAKAVDNLNTTEWPSHFHELLKIFKALNTVIAFCSSRQHIATTFSVVRKSVEGIMKRPLELSKVAEIKAVIPELVRFAYIPAADIRIHSDRVDGSSRKGSKNGRDDDIYAPQTSSLKDDEQVLVLEFVEQKKGKKEQSGPLPSYSLPPSLSPQAVKKLIEKRNERFIHAVNELILACNSTPDAEDPVTLVVTAAREHIPIDPTAHHLSEVDDSSTKAIPKPESRPTIEDILTELEFSEEYRQQIVGRRVFEVKEPVWGQLSRPLSDSIATALRNFRNISGFYSHQAAAINAILDGKHVIVSTGTASGKSVIYQVPLLTFLEENPDAKAIFIYPTKALAQDQKTALEQLLSRCPGLESIQVATYDGDTPMENRAGIRDTASVIFTNFDMLHAGILPHEDVWRGFFKNLQLVVVDELHYYSGVLGTHVAFIMRRLRRVCVAVGNRRSRFVSCSATIANPKQHMSNIFGVQDIEVITEDGSPAGRKDFLVWEPPRIDSMDPHSTRISAITEACTLFKHLMKKGVRTIVFCKIRKSCELVMKNIRVQLATEGRSDILARVRAYRGGYSQEDRREIEKEAFSGKLLGIVATNALELGVDIGTLDAVIMVGFPFSVASLRQQAGRAGRRARDSLALLVCDTLPIDQHFVKNPDEVFDKAIADLVVDLDNRVIMESHLQCAADEMPISVQDDERYFGPELQSVCQSRLVRDDDGWYHTNPNFKPRPSTHVAIRGGQEVKYVVLNYTDVEKTGNAGLPKVLEEIEISRALFETYEGGIFLHQGMTFLVREVSHDSRTARVVATDVNWITKPRDFTNVDPTQTTRIRAIRNSPHRAYYGNIDVCTVIFGFFKIRNNVILDAVDLETPPFEHQTQGMWVDVPRPILDLMRRKGLNPAEGIHSAAHAVLNLAPLFAMASGGDIRTECKAAEKEYAEKASKRKRPARLIFYDNVAKSSGICAKAFDHISDLLHQAQERVESCDCQQGCPACIESPNCSEGNLVYSKIGAQVIIRGILDLPIDEDAIPDLEPEVLEAVKERVTVVEASGVRAVEGIVLEDEE